MKTPKGKKPDETRRGRGPAQPENRRSRIAQKTKPSLVAPDLSYIAEPLRAFAVPIDSVVLDPKNARKHGEENLKAIESSLRRFGQRLPIVVQRDGMVVRAGNGRVQVARKMGWTHIAAVVVEDGDEAATAFAILDNQSGALAEWDDAVLAELLKSLPHDLRIDLGFNTEALAEALAPGANLGMIDPDDVPGQPDAATTAPGDIWVLGNHRLMCGDSSKPEDLDRLLDGQPIHLVNTDPPYNVKVEPRSNNAIVAGLSSLALPGEADQHDQQSADLNRYPEKSRATHKKLRAKDRPLANDFVTDEAFDRLLAAWFGNITRVLIPGGTFYIWGGYTNCGNYPPVLKACKLYGWKDGAAHRFFGPANVPDTWSVKKVNPQSMVHLTEKPVELARRAIEFSSRPGENVLDLFGGSGSTLIGAEMTGSAGVPDGARRAVLRRHRAALGEVHGPEGRTRTRGGGRGRPQRDGGAGRPDVAPPEATRLTPTWRRLRHSYPMANRNLHRILLLSLECSPRNAKVCVSGAGHWRTRTMNETTKNTIEIAKTLGRRGFTVAGVEVYTPDGRTWEIAAVPAGRGRRADGSWGPIAGAGGGFRLFEIDRDGRDGPNEHDAIDGDTWTASDLVDYLRAVGEPKNPTGCSTH